VEYQQYPTQRRSEEHDAEVPAEQQSLEPERRKVLVEGLAAQAYTFALQKKGRAEALPSLIDMMVKFRTTDPTIPEDAAADIVNIPEPPDEPPEEIARKKAIRDMLGVTSAEDELLAALTARDWLERLAGDLRNAVS
jgi:hypothetical protein